MPEPSKRSSRAAARARKKEVVGVDEASEMVGVSVGVDEVIEMVAVGVEGASEMVGVAALPTHGPQ